MNPLNPNPVKNPVALVTGAGPGLGGALAVGLARAGARLVICDIDLERLALTEQRLLAMGAEVLARVCDVSDSAAVDVLVAGSLWFFWRASRSGDAHLADAVDKNAVPVH